MNRETDALASVLFYVIYYILRSRSITQDVYTRIQA